MICMETKIINWKQKENKNIYEIILMCSLKLCTGGVVVVVAHYTQYGDWS